MKLTFNNSLQITLIRQDLWELTSDFSFNLTEVETEKNTKGFTRSIPKGFRTDLASVPRMPFAYLLAGGIGAKAAVVHDYFYTVNNIVSKETADKAFLAGLKECGVSWYRRYPMYLAVKLFGNYEK